MLLFLPESPASARGSIQQPSANAGWRGDAMFQQNIGNNTTSSKPFLTADGWVWFRGTNNILWRVFNDGSDQSSPLGRKTWTTPFVTADGWVWFQDIDYKLY